jgi:acyl-CoA synthetase (AMP-forming)/AMP-acid ligase II
VAAVLGALGAGRAFTLLHHKLRPPQVEHILRQTRAPLALIDSTGLGTLRGDIEPDSPITAARWWLPEYGLVAGAERLRRQAAVETWSADGWNCGPLPSPDEVPRQVGACLFTSGSTGSSKGVLLDTANLDTCAAAEARWFGLTERDVLLSILPFSFDVGLMQLFAAVTAGCELVVLDSWFPRDILSAAAACRVTGISAVPSIWLNFLTYRQRFRTCDEHAALRYITVSGGDLDRRDLARLPEVVGDAGIFKTYGQTETFRSTALRPCEFAARPTSVGRPFGGAHVYVVRANGTQAAPGEEGEVVHTGPGIMLGYLDGQDVQHKLRPNPFAGPGDPSPRAVFTGDIGTLDEAGYLFLRGRCDDMVKVNGYRVYPGDVRERLLSVAGVAQAEVVALTRDSRTHLVAFMVGEAEHGPDPVAVRGYLSRVTPSYMVPELVVSLPTLPRTSSGKPDRQALLTAAEDLLALPAVVCS